MPTSQPTIPLTVIGGYLGAGKTTLVNHLLTTSDRRLGVIVNDFGDINIDAALITRRDTTTIELTNGCVCCSLSSNLATGLRLLLDRDHRPDQILVEASGVADPKAVAEFGHGQGMSRDGVVVVVDAETVRNRAGDRYTGRTVIEQLGAADLLVLNKVDLVDESELADVREWLWEHAPGTPMIDTRHGAVAPEIALGTFGSQQSAPQPDRPLADQATDHETRTYTVPDEITRAGLTALCNALPKGVVRAKGIVEFADEPGHWLVQLVGRRLAVTLSPLEPSGDIAGRVVLIGVSGSLPDVDQLVSSLR